LDEFNFGPYQSSSEVVDGIGLVRVKMTPPGQRLGAGIAQSI